MRDLASQIMRRVEALGRISDEPGRLTRTFCSPAMRRANQLAGAWMRQAGMAVRQDAVGNLIGHYAAKSPKSKVRGLTPEKVLLLGSHLDTVRNAGSFDGPLGVLLGIGCVEHLKRNRVRLPFGLEVIGFADEEGVRYQTAYLGSRAVAGCLDSQCLLQKDAAGISMAEAIRGFGGEPKKLEQARFDPRRLVGYLEAHIEQGPRLEHENLALGLVTTIGGQARLRITFAGRAAHAGSTPMRLRQDALCAAAEFILAVEHHAGKTAALVATVGQIQIEPNASNVIPGKALLTLDVRHPRDSVRAAAVARLRKIAGQIAADRKLRVAASIVQPTASVPCSPELSGLLKRALRKRQSKVLALPSGAGHDAAILAGLTPVAMLFIRCKGGISHHPDESVRLADVRVALAVMSDFITMLAERPSWWCSERPVRGAPLG
jgi:allantoate deiminase